MTCQNYKNVLSLKRPLAVRVGGRLDIESHGDDFKTVMRCGKA